MNRRDWLLTIIGWDGCLPLLVAIAPAFFPFVIPGRDLAELTAVIMVPIVAALVRAHFGYRQLEKYRGRATLGRQLLFGLAIAVLLLFEGLSAVLHCANVIPPSVWFTAGAIYLVYLSLMVPVLRTPVSEGD